MLNDQELEHRTEEEIEQQIEKLEENLNYDNSRDVMSSVVICISQI